MSYSEHEWMNDLIDNATTKQQRSCSAKLWISGYNGPNSRTVVLVLVNYTKGLQKEWEVKNEKIRGIGRVQG